ncbi:MAG: peptidoglycan DD-metalloendopeptidase family protein [Syntrophomonadaceae bacterium]|jgi:murein DD-endopeptidase MepM/ murein hydrolase activator NlpD
MISYLRQRQQLVPAVCAALAVMIFSCMWLLAAKASAIAVIIDGQPQFLAKSSQEVQQALMQMQLDQEAQFNLNLELGTDVQFKEVFALQSSLVPSDQLAALLEQSVCFEAVAATIMVNDQAVASLVNEDEARQLVEQFTNEFGAADEGEKLIQVGFEEQVEVLVGRVPLQQICTREQAYHLISIGVANPEKYVVQEGDNLWLIARRNDTYVDEIKKANHLTSDNLSLGQELIVVKSKPLLTVVAQVEGEKVEAIPYETEVVVDASAPTRVRVKQEGSDGEKKITYQAVKRNGVIAQREITSEEVLKNPVARVLVKGNQVVQVASRGSGGVSKGVLDWPIYGPISNYYRSSHPGIDITGRRGSTLRAANSGYVVSAGWAGGYGKCVVIDHGNGYATRYAHCDSLNVSVGQKVSRGQGIATLGSTGRSSGPHIHFEVTYNGSKVNPLSVLK